MTLDDFKSIISVGDRFVLVDFFAVWCGPCKVMHPVMDAVEAQMGATLDVIRLDVDNFENHDVVSQFRINAVPTFILFYEGRQVWRRSGVMSESEFIEELRYQERVAVY
ncbi:MAG: thioredoxin fold domain-containing protein [Alistipes sp.]|nr:thioredoxin fold domain-containing protein [Alistipes sp.]